MTVLEKTGEEIYKRLNAEILNIDDESLYSILSGDIQKYTVDDIMDYFYDDYNDITEQANELELQVLCKDIAEHLNCNIKTIQARFKAFHKVLSAELSS